MRAAVFHGREDVRIEDVPEPSPGPGELLLEVRATGICGTDAAEFRWGPRMFPIASRHPETGHVGPMIPGHEIAGVVVEVGPGAEGFSVGDLVVSGAGVWCERCMQCRAGRTNLCERYATVGLQRHGGLAQYCAVPAKTCVAVPPGLSPDAAALAQPMAIGVHAMRRGEPRPGEPAVVIGAGGIGGFLIHALARFGVEVVAVDLKPPRLSIAARLGAAHAIDPRQASIAEALRGLGLRPALVCEVSGTASGLEAALEVVRPGGRVVAVGLQEHPRPIDVRALTLREVSLVGTVAHVCRTNLPEAVRLLASRPEPWSDLAPTALSLDRLVSDGLRPMAEGRGERIKTLVDPWAEEPRPTRMGSGEDRRPPSTDVRGRRGGMKSYKASIEPVRPAGHLRAKEGWIAMAVQFLVDEEAAGARKLVFGRSVFPPGARHEIHRHGAAEEVVFLVEGQGIVTNGDEEFPLARGEVAFTPQNEWHGFRNTSETDQAVLLWVWGGAGSIGAAGYEPRRAP